MSLFTIDLSQARAETTVVGPFIIEAGPAVDPSGASGLKQIASSISNNSSEILGTVATGIALGFGGATLVGAGGAAAGPAGVAEGFAAGAVTGGAAGITAESVALGLFAAEASSTLAAEGAATYTDLVPELSEFEKAKKIQKQYNDLKKFTDLFSKPENSAEDRLDELAGKPLRGFWQQVWFDLQRGTDPQLYERLKNEVAFLGPDPKFSTGRYQT